ncbi:hypothetical protein [Hephaestia mangrovi]|uniref:hypothetical protein n=1 Tax=Hephaestia mangrovi TaxID=2873268 RepID=UPI002103D0D8|nr:hypothetical protein [Hephaestia mangrovi]
MAEIDDSEPAEHSHTPPGWPIEIVEFKPSGKAPKKYGDNVYRFGAALTMSVILPRRGWTLVKKSKDYAYLKPPPGEAGPPFRISIAVPTQAECVALAERSYARGESWMGQLGEWPAWYYPERNRDTRRLWRNRATGEMESELLPSPPESSLHIGEWGIWEAKATGQAGRFAVGMFAPGTIPNLALSEPTEPLIEGAATPVELTRYENAAQRRAAFASRIMAPSVRRATSNMRKNMARLAQASFTSIMLRRYRQSAKLMKWIRSTISSHSAPHVIMSCIDEIPPSPWQSSGARSQSRPAKVRLISDRARCSRRPKFFGEPHRFPQTEVKQEIGYPGAAHDPL